MHARLYVGVVAFLLALGAFEVAYLVLGTPRPVGPIIALVLSTLIVLDPGRLLSDTPNDR